jgi:hypothetical protein
VLLDALDEMPEMSVVHSDMHIIHSAAESTADALAPDTVWTLERRNPANASRAHMLLRNNVTGCSMLMHAALARRFGVVPEAFGFHDHWFAVVAAHHGGIRPVHSPLLRHRQHGGNTVGSRKRDSVVQRVAEAGFRQLFRNLLGAHARYLRRLEAARQQGLGLDAGAQRQLERPASASVILSFGAMSLRWSRGDPFLAREAFKVAVGSAASRLGVRYPA